MKTLVDASPWDLKVIGIISHDLAQKVGGVMYNDGTIQQTDKYPKASRITEEHVDLVCKQWLARRRRQRNRKGASTE